ncbi:MAG: pilus assembly FimT family protein [Kiritimatiellia bacterium]
MREKKSEVRSQRSGGRVQGSGFRVQGSGNFLNQVGLGRRLVHHCYRSGTEPVLSARAAPAPYPTTPSHVVAALLSRSQLVTPHSPRPQAANGICAANSGFTMIEVVSVLAIIVVMLSIALGSYYGWARTAGIDAAANLTASVLGHARELAITQGVENRTRVRCSNVAPTGRQPGGRIAVYTYGIYTNTDEQLCTPTNTLPASVCFLTEQTVDFGADGACYAANPMSSNGCVRFILDSTAGEAARRLTRVVEVNLLSGRIRVRREDEP